MGLDIHNSIYDAFIRAGGSKRLRKSGLVNRTGREIWEAVGLRVWYTVSLWGGPKRTSLFMQRCPHISHGDVHGLNSLTCPRSAPQKLEARRNTGVVREASNINLFAQGLPTVERH